MDELTESAQQRSEHRIERWALIRDVLVFQVKLIIDGVRDLILGPVSVGAALLGLLSRKNPRGLFDDVLGLGRRTERWINLFGKHDEPVVEPPQKEPANVDALVRRLEATLRDKAHRGGLTASARDKIDELLDGLQPDDRPHDDRPPDGRPHDDRPPDGRPPDGRPPS